MNAFITKVRLDMAMRVAERIWKEDGMDERTKGYLSIEVSGADKRSARSGEREKGKRYWDGQVNSYLSHVNFMLKLSCCGARSE